MADYKLYKNHASEPCFKIQMAWNDQAQPDWRGSSQDEENLIPVEDCLVWDDEVQDWVIDEDFLNEWTEQTVINSMDGDWDDISDITWNLELNS